MTTTFKRAYFLFLTLNKDDKKIYDSLSCFQAIITLILATDMARHGEILEGFKQKLDKFDFTNEEHVTCVCKHFLLQNHHVFILLYSYPYGLGIL